jgi:photosystem II stability/assembly factor-like uncharacterized protein
MKRTHLFLFFLILIVITISINRAKSQTWQSIPLVSQKILNNGNTGGEGGQIIQSIKIDHNEGSFLLMGTDVGGIYRSTNGGLRWEACNVGYNPRGNAGFAIDPNNNQRALAVGGNSISNSSHGLYLTTDQGTTWKHVLAVGDYAKSFNDKIEFVKASFSDSLGGMSMIAYWSSPSGGIYKTVNGGYNWTRVNNSYGDCVLKVNPENGDIYVGNSTGFYKSSDGGVTFNSKATLIVTDIDVVIAAPNSVFIATPDGLFKSTDGGESFTRVDISGYPANVVTLAVSPADTNYMVVCDKVNFYGGPFYYSHDGGKNWQQGSRNNENAFLPHNTRRQKFAWHPTDRNKLWALGGDWITSSKDGGKNVEWDANGYTGVLVGGFFNFNVFNPDLLFVGSQDYNGAFTKDGGRSWKYCNASGLGWGGFTYGAYALDEDILVTMVAPAWHQPGPIAISKNGGNSFTQTSFVSNGLRVGCGDAKDPNVIYFREYYSKDKGETWNIMHGCNGVLIANLYGQKEVYGGYGNKVVKSTDLGDTWQTIVTLPSEVSDIAIDHINNKLFIITKSNNLFIFRNGVLTEITAKVPLDQYNERRLLTVAVDPHDPKIVYTGGAKNVYKTDAAVSRSRDGGNTWEIITPNNRTNDGFGNIDGVNEVYALRVHPVTRELWATGGCYGIWKMLSEYNTRVQLSSPQEGTSIIAAGQIELNTIITGNDIPIMKVEFYNDTGKIGEAYEAPFACIWAGPGTGEYEIYAIATDNSGNTTISNKIRIKVLASALPVVSLVSPGNNEEFEYRSTICIIAHAYDPDSYITKVEFYSNGNKLGEITEAPYEFNWENVPDGTYTLLATATDNTNHTVASGPVTIIVKMDPGTIFYLEDFNDGLAQDWVPEGGIWEVIDNQYRSSSSGATENSIYHGSSFADFTFSARAKSNWNNDFGLIFNYQDAQNYYMIVLDASPMEAYLKMRKDGFVSILAESEYAGGGAYVYVTIEIQNDGYYTTVKVNNDIIFDNIPTPEFNYGKIGLYTDWNIVWFDDIQVKAQGQMLYARLNHNNNLSPEIRVFPNPVVSGQFSIHFSGMDLPVQVYIYDIKGKLIHSFSATDKKINLSVESFIKPGLYMIILVNDNARLQSKLLISK